MNSLIEVIKISKALYNWRQQAQRDGIHYVWREFLCQTLPTRGIEGKDSYFFLTSIFAFVCMLCYRILQNDLLDLYLVSIRRFKLSFFAKAVRRAFFVVPWSSKHDRGWNWAHNSLNLLTSCGPNLEGIGSDVIFCEFLLFFSRISVQI